MLDKKLTILSNLDKSGFFVNIKLTLTARGLWVFMGNDPLLL